jgi:hypothetical protein
MLVRELWTPFGIVTNFYQVRGLANKRSSGPRRFTLANLSSNIVFLLRDILVMTSPLPPREVHEITAPFHGSTYVLSLTIAQLSSNTFCCS